MSISLNDDAIKTAFEKHGILFTPPGINAKEIIVDAINARLSSDFEKNADNLITKLKSDSVALQDLNAMFDKVALEGYVAMHKAKPQGPRNHLVYHTPEGHIPEIMEDSKKETLRQLGVTFNAPQDDIANVLFANLARAAAAWHDVVQNLGAPKNEIESAKLFAKSMQTNLNAFKVSHPQLAGEVAKFQTNVDFISQELIVNDTWLLFSKKGDTVKARTLGEYINEVASDANVTLTAGPNMKRLMTAAAAVSQSDTSRFSLEHVLNDQVLLKSFATLNSDLQAPLNKFFSQAKITDPRMQEQFLGLISQNFRMFPELNMPASHPSATMMTTVNISSDDHQSVLNAVTGMREGNTSDIDFKKVFELFIHTQSLPKNPGPPAMENIIREQNFGRAQPQAMWHEHSNRLAEFQKFVNAPENSEKLALLGECIATLAIKFQPGVQLTAANPSYQEAVDMHDINEALDLDVSASFDDDDDLLAEDLAIAQPNRPEPVKPELMAALQPKNVNDNNPPTVRIKF